MTINTREQPQKLRAQYVLKCEQTGVGDFTPLPLVVGGNTPFPLVRPGVYNHPT